MKKTGDCPEFYGLYSHVPFCVRKCPYCAFCSVPLEQGDPERMVRALVAEAKLYGAFSADTIYVGGGSPSCLPPQLMTRLLSDIARYGTAGAEFTVEVNPGQVETPLIDRLGDVGVNRISIGTQSFHQDELDLLGRPYDVAAIEQAVHLLGAGGFDNIGLDLIYALPGQSVAAWRESLRRAVDLAPEHLSLYSLTYEPGTALYDASRQGRVVPVDDAVDREMYDLALEVLSDAGFEQYEISNFARPGRACRHNMKYWACEPFIGIGPSAASFLPPQRLSNTPDLDRYCRQIEQGRFARDEVLTLTQDDLICELAVLNLRRRGGVDLAEFERRTGHCFAEIFARPLQGYIEQGLLEQVGGSVRLAPQALGIADTVLCGFASL